MIYLFYDKEGWILMKKMTTLCASLLLALGCLTANAMDSQTLVSNPGRYRVISTSPDGIAYADMDSLRAMQTMDYPNSIENMSFTLYVEKYAGIRDDLIFQLGQEIHQINEYKAALHANKREGTYDLNADLTNVYHTDGTAYSVKIDTVQFQNIRDMYTALHHFAALMPQKN